MFLHGTLNSFGVVSNLSFHFSFFFNLDVIGCLHEVIRRQKPGNGNKAIANIALSDAGGNNYDCTR